MLNRTTRREQSRAFAGRSSMWSSPADNCRQSTTQLRSSWTDGRRLIAEIQEHLDLRTVRAVAMENTSGLRRGAIAPSERSDLRAGGGEGARPSDQRDLAIRSIASGRSSPAHRAGRFIAARPRSIGRITSARSSAPASRSSTCSPRSRAAARPGCSAARASARRC